MKLVKSRPRIGVKVPAEIRPGEALQATVELTCRRPVVVEHVDVVFEGTERWQLGSGKGAVKQRRSLLRLGARLCERRELPIGVTSLPVRIPLPAEAPPTHRGGAADLGYELSVHAEIDWWPDARASFEIPVSPPWVPSPATGPALYSSAPEGPRGREPHAELSLASSWTRAGDVVRGAFALSNVEHHRYSEARVGLHALECLHFADGHFMEGRPYRELEHTRYHIRIGAEQAREGEMIPFAFRLPADVPMALEVWPRPDGRRGLLSVRWELELEVGVRWGRDLRLRAPFQVLPASARASDAPVHAAPPTVGTDRLRVVWEGVAREHGLHYEAQALTSRVGETQLVVRRDHAGREGTFLVAELSYPDLHLDLVVEPASDMRKLVGGGVRVGDEAWDRDHYVLARDAEQAALFLRPLLGALAGASLRRVDDRHLAVELRDAGQSRQRLSHFVGAAVDLARRFERARGAPPPPTGMEEAVSSWRELAQHLHAPLETARMRVEGELGMYGAEVRLAFDERGLPMATWLSVRASAPFDEAACFAWTAPRGPLSAALPSRMPAEQASLLARIAEDASALAVERERISLGLPRPLGVPGAEGRTIPVRVAHRRLEQMAQLATLLRGEAGPYR